MYLQVNGERAMKMGFPIKMYCCHHTAITVGKNGTVLIYTAEWWYKNSSQLQQ